MALCFSMSSPAGKDHEVDRMACSILCRAELWRQKFHGILSKQKIEKHFVRHCLVLSIVSL